MLLKIYSPKRFAVSYEPPPEIHRQIPKRFPKWPMLLLVGILIILSSKPFLEYDEKGTPRLALWRKQKLEKEIEELDEAEQYVIVAAIAGNYPCYSCVASKTIFLNKGEVWKYGMTTKGKGGRYGNKLEPMNLLYIVQFKGTIEQCLKEERRKIYQYAILPENLKRKTPLIRPPGNKKDS